MLMQVIVGTLHWVCSGDIKWAEGFWDYLVVTGSIPRYTFRYFYIVVGIITRSQSEDLFNALWEFVVSLFADLWTPPAASAH